MFSKELVSFIDGLDLFIKNKRSNNYNKERDILVRTIKINEEVGELYNEVLTSIGDQRSEKTEKYDKSNLEGEFADVIFQVLVLAKAMDVNMDESMNRKMKKIRKRFNLK